MNDFDDFAGEFKTREVFEPRILLEGLYPGAGYQIKVFAVSHELWSEPHAHFQAVCEQPSNSNLIFTVLQRFFLLQIHVHRRMLVFWRRVHRRCD